MQEINLNAPAESELIDLNHKIVERLRFLQQMRDYGAMLEFSVGDGVAFDAPGCPATTGIRVKYSKKLKLPSFWTGFRASRWSKRELSLNTRPGRGRRVSEGAV